jgi:hypothetical protein
MPLKCLRPQPLQRRESLRVRFSHADFPDVFSQSSFHEKSFSQRRSQLEKSFSQKFLHGKEGGREAR